MDKTTLRKQILEAEDLELSPCDIPEWGVSAFIRPLDGESRFRISQVATVGNKKQNSYIVEAYVCEGLVDENGEQIFPIEDRALLAKKSPVVLERLYDRIVKLSGIRTEDGAEAEKK